jgi:hypothetical protein
MWLIGIRIFIQVVRLLANSWTIYRKRRNLPKPIVVRVDDPEVYENFEETDKMDRLITINPDQAHASGLRDYVEEDRSEDDESFMSLVH